MFSLPYTCHVATTQVCHSWRQLAEATDEELDAWEASSARVDRLDRQTAGLEVC